MARLFVAVWPPPEVIAELRAVPRPDGIRWLPERNWHVTLRFVGDASADEMVECLRSSSLPASRARLGPAVERWPAGHVIVPVLGLDELAATVRAATEGLGDTDRRGYRGHLTIGRTRSGAAARSIVGTPIDAAFDVAELAVVSSETRSEGAMYTTIATCPLSG